jgi:hypothetical protein
MGNGPTGESQGLGEKNLIYEMFSLGDPNIQKSNWVSTQFSSALLNFSFIVQFDCLGIHDSGPDSQLLTEMDRVQKLEMELYYTAISTTRYTNQRPYYLQTGIMANTEYSSLTFGLFKCQM